MLLSLVSVKSLQLLSFRSISRIGGKLMVVVSSLVKQSLPGVHAKPIEIGLFENKALCVVRCLDDYIARTGHLSNSNQLLVSFIASHHGVSRDPTPRWRC